jgi:hypothetical protein
MPPISAIQRVKEEAMTGGYGSQSRTTTAPQDNVDAPSEAELSALTREIEAAAAERQAVEAEVCLRGGAGIGAGGVQGDWGGGGQIVHALPCTYRGSQTVHANSARVLHDVRSVLNPTT